MLEKKKTGSEMPALSESKTNEAREVLSVITITPGNIITISDYGSHFDKEIVKKLKKSGLEIEIIFDSPCG